MNPYHLVERPERDQLGEAPFWDEATQTLYWVDIVGKRAHRFDPSTGEIVRWTTPRHVSACIPTTSGDLIAPMVDGVFRLDPKTGETRLFCRPDDDAGNRSNECRTDARGRLWLGTMCNNLDHDGAALPLDRSSGGVFCIEADGAFTQMFDEVGITNTFCWSPDGLRFYTADSLKGVIWAHDYDPERPTIRNREVFVDDGPGGPDGSAMDEEGCLWNARWGGGRVIRFTPDGKVDREIMLPVAQPSSCAFGGPDRKTLFITSARQELVGLDPGSLDGGLFAVDVDVAGLPMARFKG